MWVLSCSKPNKLYSAIHPLNIYFIIISAAAWLLLHVSYHLLHFFPLVCFDTRSSGTATERFRSRRLHYNEITSFVQHPAKKRNTYEISEVSHTTRTEIIFNFLIFSLCAIENRMCWTMLMMSRIDRNIQRVIHSGLNKHSWTSLNSWTFGKLFFTL